MSLISENSKPGLGLVDIFMRNKPKKETPIKIDGKIHIACEMIIIVMCSVVLAKLAARFLKIKEGKITRCT